MNAQDAERIYRTVKSQLDSGQITLEEYNRSIAELRYQDNTGTWWAISPQDGSWLKWTGGAWIPGFAQVAPPDPQPPFQPAATPVYRQPAPQPVQQSVQPAEKPSWYIPPVRSGQEPAEAQPVLQPAAQSAPSSSPIPPAGTQQSDTLETEYYIRPEDIQGEITLKRYKDYDYFVYSVLCLLISYFLFFIIHVNNILPFITFIIGLIGTGVFGLLTLVSGDTGKTYRNIDKILVTATGIALRDYQGKVKYLMPFAKVTNIRYGYREHVVSVALDLGARVPIFVQFDLADGKKFTILMDYIIGADKTKIFSYLPVFR